MIVGDGTAYSDAGEIRHLFDQRFSIKITKLDTRNFNRFGLSRYTHIILPNSRGNALGKSEADKLKDWVKAGHILI